MRVPESKSIKGEKEEWAVIQLATSYPAVPGNLLADAGKSRTRSAKGPEMAMWNRGQVVFGYGEVFVMSLTT